MQPYIPPVVSTPPTMDNFSKTIPVQYVDASRDNAPFNQNMYTGFDPINLYAGIYTNVDQVHGSTRKEAQFSDNAMDPNWGGVSYTAGQIQTGKYDDNLVTTPTYSASVNTFAIPSFRPLLDPVASPATQAPLTSLLSSPSSSSSTQ